MINISQFCQESSSKTHQENVLGHKYQTWILWARGILFAPCCRSWLLFFVFQIYYWKAQGSSKRNRRHIEKKILTFQGSKTHGMLPGLEPYSHYTLNVRVVNGKGEGPASPDRVFNTPEGGMGVTCLWDPRTYGASWDALHDRRAPNRAGIVSAHMWPWGRARGKLYFKMLLPPTPSPDLNFSPHWLTPSETLLIWCLLGSLTFWPEVTSVNFLKSPLLHLWIP